MIFLESTQERDASAMAEFGKAAMLPKDSFAMSRHNPALLVLKAVVDYFSLHRKRKLD
jgi:hypothetical protein